MALYTENVSNPSPVTGSIPVHEGVGSAIGGALGGLAKILDVGLKASAQDRQDKILGNLEDQLGKETQTWGPSKQAPTLVGEKTDPTQEAMQTAPGIRRGFGQIDSLRQGNAQGEDRVSTAEFMGRASVIVQRMIHDHPRFADAIRERAQRMLGTNPTAEMLSINRQDEDALRKQQEAVQMDLVKGAIDVGNVVMDSSGNGKIDMAQTASNGLKVKQTEHDLKVVGIKLDDRLKELEIQGKERGLKPTAEEINMAQRNTLRDLLDPEFNSIIESGFKNLKTSKLLEGGESPQNQTALLEAIGRTKATAMARVQQLALQARTQTGDKIDSKNIEDVMKMYNDTFSSWEDLAKGPLSEFEGMTRAYKQLEIQAGMNFAQASPFLFQLKASLGENAIGTIVAGLTQAAGPNRDMIAGKLQNWLTEMSNVASGHGGLKSPEVAKGVTDTLDSFNMRPNELNTTELGAWGNMTAAVVQQGMGFGSAQPGQVQAVADRITSAGAQRAFDVYAKAHPEEAQGLGEQLISLSRHNVEVQAKNVQPITLRGQTNVGAGGKMERHDITYDTTYNAMTGRMELHIKDEKGKDLTTNPQLLQNVPPSMTARINAVNRSLAAAAHYKDYGTDQDRSLPESQLKLSIATGAGIPVEKGTLMVVKPVEANKPASVTIPKTDPNIIKNIESGSLGSKAVSPVGAMFDMQVMPAVAHDPGFGIKPAASDTPDEYNRVGKELIEKLDDKYGNPIFTMIGYNWGSGHLAKWIAEGADFSKLPKETKMYISKYFKQLAGEQEQAMNE